LARLLVPDNRKDDGDGGDGGDGARSGTGCRCDSEYFRGYYEYVDPELEGFRSVWVVGTHLQADQLGFNGTVISGEEARKAQMGEINGWIWARVLAGKFKIDIGDPLIFAGDFNVKFREENEAFEQLLNTGDVRVPMTISDYTLGSFSPKTNLMAKMVVADPDVPINMTNVVSLLTDVGFPISPSHICDDDRTPEESLTEFLRLLKIYDWEKRPSVGYISCFKKAMLILQTDGSPLLEEDYLIDYIGWHEDFLQPLAAAPLVVVEAKSTPKMHWEQMAKTLPATKGIYYDYSDHYPVFAEFYFK